MDKYARIMEDADGVFYVDCSGCEHGAENEYSAQEDVVTDLLRMHLIYDHGVTAESVTVPYIFREGENC